MRVLRTSFTRILFLFLLLQSAVALAEDQPLDLTSEEAVGESNEVVETESNELAAEPEVAPSELAIEPSAAAVAAEENTGEPAGTKITSEPFIGNTGGDFTYDVELVVPKFRGLVPALSVSYSSSRMAMSDSAAVLGQGWKLNGFSVIRRKSLGGGFPTYDDGHDVYEIDGKELLACAGYGSTTPWSSDPIFPRAYPARYVTDRASASCRNGGNLTARVDDYTRYHATQSLTGNMKWVTESFQVTRRDGVQLEYTSLGKLIFPSTTPSAAIASRYPYNNIWLLTKITDTQTVTASSGATTPNTVDLSYYFGSEADGYAYRPKEIRYGGYIVRFGYEATARPFSNFPTGTANIGKQRYALRSVQVYDGSNKIRAYGIDYTTSPKLERKLLASITEYGSDFSVLSGVISSGQSLPPTTFQYTSDSFSFQGEAYNGVEFHEVGLVHDRDADGRDELVLFPWKKVRAVPSSGGETSYVDQQVYAGRRLAWNDARSITRNEANTVSCAGTGAPSHNDSSGSGPIQNYGRSPGVYVENDRMGSRTLCLAWKYNQVTTGVGDNQETIWHLGSEVRDFEKQATPVIWSEVPGPAMAATYETYRIANLDLDPFLELMPLSGRKKLTQSGLASVVAPTTSIRPGVGAGGYLADFNGDGVTDNLWQGRLVLTLPEAKQLGSSTQQSYGTMSISVPDGPPHDTNDVPSGWTLTQKDESRLVAVGDLNGDQVNDVVFHVENRGNADELFVYFGTGQGFSNLAKVPLPNLLDRSFATSPQSKIIDVNADGLNDIIIHEGFLSPESPGVRFSSKKTWIFLNKGNNEFLQQPAYGSMSGFDGLVFVGDFDGNGFQDIVREGADGKILFGTGAPADGGAAPYRLKSVGTPLGGRIDITYTPSTAFGESRIPFTQHLATSVTMDDGRSTNDAGERVRSTTTIAYQGGAYDFIARKPLGYSVVTTSLPTIEGEGLIGPKIVRTYFTNSIATAGILQKEERYSYSGSIMARTVNEIEQITSGNGPYIARVVGTADRYQNGGWIEKKKTRNFNINGLKTQETELGFTINGVDVDAADNRKTTYTYAASSSKFILDRISSTKKTLGEGNAWLAEQQFYYDGMATLGQVTEGNVTKVVDVNRIGGTATRNSRTLTYDNYGNVVSETSALGRVTTHSYDTIKKLFKVSSTNPAGEVISQTWYSGCQSLQTQTDPNLQLTTYTLDLFCREERVDLPGGQVVETDYPQPNTVSSNTAGDPTEQYIKRTIKSASIETGKLKRISWEFFDGFGRTYRTATTGATSAGSSAVNLLTGFDARGNVSWQSIPLLGNPDSPAALQYGSAVNPDDSAAVYKAATALNLRTSFGYDSLDRQVERVESDGARTATGFLVTSIASHPGTVFTNHPGVKVRDAHCFDAAAENTLCGQLETYSDAFGNPVRQVRAENTGSGVTEYRFDGLNRITRITDPVGATWIYNFDGWGDRVTSTDPGLGVWALTYDAAHNLLSQLDAKGQTISFTYDAVNRVKTKIVTGTNYWSKVAYTYGAPGANPPGAFNVGREVNQSVRSGTQSPGALIHDVAYSYTAHGKVSNEVHTVDGDAFKFQYDYAADGTLLSQKLPINGRGALNKIGPFSHDAASRITSLPGFITSITYDPRWGGVLREQHPNGVAVDYTYDRRRGWLDHVEAGITVDAGVFNADYSRSATGRINKYDTRRATPGTSDDRGAYSFTYDSAGRLLTATNLYGLSADNQVMRYDSGGRMLWKGQSATAGKAYTYSSSRPVHAPKKVGTETFSYDENGNQEDGLAGKVITYDAENRPLTVVRNSITTCYVYGINGVRLKMYSGPGACPVQKYGNDWTLYLGPVEVKNFKAGAAEEVLAYPHPSVMLKGGIQPPDAHYFYRDHLNSVRAIFSATGTREEGTVYKPYGERMRWVNPAHPGDTAKGWIGERYDEGAGLQYLNARYYDPELGMFIQPDWWEVAGPGVGTNRFAYSFGDPVNMTDPEGNQSLTDSQRQHDQLSGMIDEAFEAMAKGEDIDLSDISDLDDMRDVVQAEIDEHLRNDDLTVMGVVIDTMRDFASRRAAVGKELAKTLTQSTRRRLPNQVEGARRHAEEVAKQKSLHPDASVQSEQYLRDEAGKILKGPDGKGRRLDIVVIKDGKIVGNPIEVTSMNARKTSQIARETAIHSNGKVYVRDRTTGKLLEITGLISEVTRIK